MSKIRVRFAPSPTGFLHLGGIRSALFDYLLAKKHSGKFILRIEDTDQERLVGGAMEQIQASLRWLGLDWDEGPDIGGAYGPYVQSERLDIYRQQADMLVASGALYPCWCSPERLDGLRKEAQTNKIAFKYDRFCLKNTQNSDLPHVLRFKVPSGLNISWQDAVKGDLSVSSDNVDDFVALKSDGFPTYHFASVVDDHLMEISHVLRGDEWVASTPKHLLLYQAFGWNPPVYAHLPQVLGTDRTKLSKRHGAKSVLEYQKEGYLPQAVLNFLVLLGWNPGEGSTQEFFNIQELSTAFDTSGVNQSPAIFEPERLDWFNGKYLRQLAPGALLEASEGFWPASAAKSSNTYKQQVLELVQGRLVKLSDLPGLVDFFFADPKTATGELPKGSQDLLESARAVLETVAFEPDELEPCLRDLATKLEIKPGVLFTAIRFGVTGRGEAPGLFETLSVLGSETVLRRLEKNIHNLSV